MQAASRLNFSPTRVFQKPKYLYVQNYNFTDVTGLTVTEEY